VMLMTIPCIELLEWRKTVVALSLAGICIQLLAVVVSGLDLVLIVHEGRMMRRAMYIRNYPGDSHIDLDDMRFNPRYSQIAGHWTLIRALLGVPPASNTSRDERVGTFIYDTLPPAAWTEGRSWDFIWLHLRQRTP